MTAKGRSPGPQEPGAILGRQRPVPCPGPAAPAAARGPRERAATGCRSLDWSFARGTQIPVGLHVRAAVGPHDLASGESRLNSASSRRTAALPS